MSGKVQHEIPQLFQRGFLIPDRGEAERIFVFRKGGNSFPSNIDRSGAESYFYSELSIDGTKTLDDEITDYEGRLGNLVNRLRAVPIGDQADAPVAAEVIAHLTTRNAHLRGAFAYGFSTIAKGALDAFSDEDNVRRLVGLDGPDVTEDFREHLSRALAKEPIVAALGIPPALLEKMAFAFIREGFSPFFAEQRPIIEFFLTKLSAEAKDHAREGHRQALAKSSTPDLRVAMLSDLTWTVVTVEHDLIVPDCVALAIEDDGDIHPLMMATPKHISTALLPLTSRTLLVGVRDGESNFDPAMFNQAAAACSHTYFLCASQTPERLELVKSIGSRSVTVVENAVLKGMAKLLPGGEAEAAHADNQTRVNSALSIPVSYHGEFDEPQARAISDAISDLLGSAAWTMPLDRLDGITIADDYPAALASLDRGKLGIRSPQTRQDDKGIGVAQCPNVLRDGVLKSHIVLQGFITRNLLSDDADQRAHAEYIIANQLAHAGFTQIFDESLPGVLMSRVDGLDGLLQVSTYPAWNAYFAGRAAAPFGYAGRFEDEQEIVMIGLEELFQAVPEARDAYRLHGDMDRFLGEVMPRLAFFFEHAAGLLGHADGLDQDVFFAAPVLTAELEKRELKAWYADFRRDLAYLWDRRGRWDSFANFLALNRHAERLLWIFPVVPWVVPDGTIRIEVPFTPTEMQTMAEQPSAS